MTRAIQYLNDMLNSDGGADEVVCKWLQRYLQSSHRSHKSSPGQWLGSQPSNPYCIVLGYELFFDRIKKLRVHLYNDEPEEIGLRKFKTYLTTQCIRYDSYWYMDIDKVQSKTDDVPTDTVEKENINDIYKRERQEQKDALIKCLFGGTEHIAGGEGEAYNLINMLIREGYLKPGALLHSIGNAFEQELRVTNKNYKLC